MYHLRGAAFWHHSSPTTLPFVRLRLLSSIGWHLQSQSFNCIISISFRCTGEVHTKAGWVVFFWPPNATCSKSVPQNYHIPLPAELMTPMTYDLWLIFWDVSWKRTLFEQNMTAILSQCEPLWRIVSWNSFWHRSKIATPKVSSCVGFSGSKQVQTRAHVWPRPISP